MRTHAAVVVDTRRGVRMPFVRHRELRFGLPDDGYGWSTFGGDAVLREVDGAFTLRSGASPAPVEVGFDLFDGTFRLERSDTLIESAHRVGDFVLFNVWLFSVRQASWRGVDLSDASRTIVDVTIRPPRPPRATPSLTGVPLTTIMATTSAQQASLDPTIARAIVAPLANKHAALEDVIVGWNGEVRDLAMRNAEPAAARRALIRLTRRTSVDELERVQPASAEEVAFVLRGLYPEDWALERSIREEAALLS